MNRGELVHTFLRKSVFWNRPVTARELILSTPFDAMREFWSKIVCPRVTLLPFEGAVDLAREGIASLFTNFNYGAGLLAGTFFPPRFRNAILQAAADETLLEMAYHGRVRLVEPYSLAYKIRRDGLVREYFVAYDATGGNSGPGLKSFVHSDVAWLRNTERKFRPRYPIELAKSARRERASYFSSPTSGTRRSYAPLRRGATRVRSGESYKVECSYCGKTFTRKTHPTRLSEHKDGLGNRCPGRAGFRVL